MHCLVRWWNLPLPSQICSTTSAQVQYSTSIHCGRDPQETSSPLCSSVLLGCKLLWWWAGVCENTAGGSWLFSARTLSVPQHVAWFKLVMLCVLILTFYLSKAEQRGFAASGSWAYPGSLCDETEAFSISLQKIERDTFYPTKIQIQSSRFIRVAYCSWENQPWQNMWDS